jgi:A/G-specific adenine glycosylase
VPELLTLPGVGDYTARAVAVFAFGQRAAVVDTNVRRVVARLVEGVEDAAVRRRDLALVESLLPDEGAPELAIALMELGALVCTARSPRHEACPVSASCEWLAAGTPPLEGPVRPPQGYAGTDRQVRGRLLAVLRDSPSPVTADVLDQTWSVDEQRSRALAGLLADGLVRQLPDGTFSL